MLLLCVSIPSFMINLDANIVAVSLPMMSRSLHADFSAIEWIISSYTLPFACLVLPAGALADRYGRKRLLLLGLAIFTGASFACGAAPSLLVLNIARALQGVGAAFQLSAALAILSQAFTGTERARAFAFWGAVVGVAITLGPVAGGVITEALGWEWAFYINVPIGLVLIGMALYVVSESCDPNAGRVDLAGFLTFSASVFALTLALISGNARGWSSPPILGALIAAAFLFAGFLLVEARHARPMIDLRLFTRPTFLGANIAALAFAATLLTMLTYLPVYFQGGLGLGPRQAGLLMLPLVIPLFIVPRLTAVHLAHRLSGRGLLTLGLALTSSGLFALAIALPATAYWPLAGGLLLTGVGAGILNSEVVRVGMTVIPPERAGMASGVSGTVRFAGIVLGFAALGAVMAGRLGVVFERSSLRLALQLQGLDPVSLAHRVAAGDLVGAVAGVPEPARSNLHIALLWALGEGYRAILLTASGAAALAALAAWLLVRPTDTAPTPHRPDALREDIVPIE